SFAMPGRRYYGADAPAHLGRNRFVEPIMPVRNTIRALLPSGVVRAIKATTQGVKARRSAFRRWRARPNVFQLDTPERVGIVFGSPSEMSTTERLFLYAFVRSQRP